MNTAGNNNTGVRRWRAVAAAARGFTLIELLVVIAIIALLVSILLPSLNQAKLVAQAAVCGSNMKQLGNVFHLYGAENDDCLPRYYFAPGMTIGAEYYRFYDPYITTNYVGRFQDDIADVTLIFDCPTTTAKVWQCGYIGDEPGDYGYNSPYLHAGVKTKRFDYGILRNVGETRTYINQDKKLSDWEPDQELVAEAFQFNAWYSNVGYNNSWVFDYWVPSGGHYGLGDHHFGEINTLYIDASVQRVDYRVLP